MYTYTYVYFMPYTYVDFILYMHMLTHFTFPNIDIYIQRRIVEGCRSIIESEREKRSKSERKYEVEG